MLARRAAIPFMIVVVSLAVATVATAGSWLISPNEYYTELRSNRFSSDRIWDSAGLSMTLPATGTFERRSLSSYSEIGWKPNMSFVMDIPLVSQTFRTAAPGFQATETGLADLTFGLKYRVREGPTALTVEADWTTPAGYDRAHFPALGPGTNDVTGSLRFGTALPSLQSFVDLSGGYRYRFEAPLNEMVGSADVGVWFGDHLLVLGRYQMLMSVESGATAAEERSLHAAGPEFRYRVDDLIDAFAGWSHSFKGENLLDVDDVYVGVSFRHTQLNRLQGLTGNMQRP